MARSRTARTAPARAAPWVALAAAALAAWLAAPAGAHVYWTSESGDAIGRAQLDGSGAIRNFIPVGDSPRSVAIDGTFAYWAQGVTQGSVGRVRLDRTGKRPGFIATGNSPQGVTLDSFGIYWTHKFGGGGRIGRAGLDGGGVVPEFIPTGPAPCGIAASPDKLYWANGGNPGAIGEAHGPFDFEQDFVNASGHPCGVAITSTHVYWANRSGDSIGRAKLDGSRVRQRFISTPNPCGVAVDASRILWTSKGTDAIGRARRDGSRIRSNLIGNLKDPCGITLDPTTTASPKIYEYPATPVGERGPIHAFFVENTSSSVLDVRRVTIKGRNEDDFHKTGDGCTIVNTAAGGGCVFNVRFRPRAAGERVALIEVASNASNSPTRIAISGRGVSG